MLERLLLKLYRHWLALRGAQLAGSARVHRPGRIARWRGIRLGEHATLYWGAELLLGAVGKFAMGARSHVAPHCYALIGNHSLVFGERVAVGPRCMFFCRSNAIPADISAQDFIDCYADGDIAIGNNVFIGAGCIVLPGTRIEDNVVLAAGAVAKGTLEAGWLYGGVPARKLKPLC